MGQGGGRWATSPAAQGAGVSRGRCSRPCKLSGPPPHATSTPHQVIFQASHSDFLNTRPMMSRLPASEEGVGERERFVNMNGHLGTISTHLSTRALGREDRSFFALPPPAAPSRQRACGRHAAHARHARQRRPLRRLDSILFGKQGAKGVCDEHWGCRQGGHHSCQVVCENVQVARDLHKQGPPGAGCACFPSTFSSARGGTGRPQLAHN